MPYARKDQITWLPGHYYHLYNRGARQLTIFREEDNYQFVLSRVKKYCVVFNISMIAYCLMSNHYHFLVRQNKEYPAGLLPQRVFNSYTKAYNKCYEHSGTLFEHRYQAKHVTAERYLLHLCRYIHANPVKGKIAANLDDWPYSNYLEWVGARLGALINRNFVRTHFASSGDYEDFVLDYLETGCLPEEVQKHLKPLGVTDGDSHVRGLP